MMSQDSMDIALTTPKQKDIWVRPMPIGMRSISLQKSRADMADCQAPAWAQHTPVTSVGHPVGHPVGLRSRDQVAPLPLNAALTTTMP